MAKKMPVISWIPKHKNRSDPKFHQAEIFTGAGRSIKLPFRALTKGVVFRIGDLRVLDLVKEDDGVKLFISYGLFTLINILFKKFYYIV